MISLVLLALCAPSAQAEAFSCGPFLLQPDTRSIVVIVDHATPVTAVLSYGRADGDARGEVRHAGAERHHVFALTGLEPDTQYAYEIHSEGLSTQEHTFRTLPVRPERYRILAVGDVRSTPKVWGQVSGRMFEHEQDALFVIGTGDYPSNGRNYGQWIDQFFVPARDFLGRMPLWPAIGNHEATRRHDDVTRTEESHFFSLFDLPGNERWYRVDYHLITLLVIDSNSHMQPGGPQYDWLRNQLRSRRNRFTLVAFHHAPLTSGPHAGLHGDGTPREWPIDEGRRFLVPLFEMYGVDLVLTGHDHLYERSEKSGVVYVVTGGGGAPLYKVNSVVNTYQQVARAVNHYVALDIDASGIDLSAIDKEGVTFDSARIAAGAAHSARRTNSLRHALESGTDCGLDPDSGETVLAHLSNPFDQPLNVSIEHSQGRKKGADWEGVLASGEQRTVALTMDAARAAQEVEPWRALIERKVKLQFEGRDQESDIKLKLEYTVILAYPTYEVAQLAAAAPEAFPSGWDGLARMRVDESTPIVRGSSSYAGTEDLEATLQLGWCMDQLHLVVEISDDDLMDAGQSNLDENDCVRVLFHHPSMGSSKIITCTFGAAGRFLCSVDDAGVTHTAQRTASGWRLQASFPFALLGLEAGAASSPELFCDFLLIDSDQAKPSPSYHRMWSKSRTRMDTQRFGRLLLAQ